MVLTKVLITGATGRTGALVFEKLQQYGEQFEVRGFARSQEKVEQRFEKPDQNQWFIGDIRVPGSLNQSIAACDALVILTSAIPVMDGPPQPGQPPSMSFPPGEMPEAVDYQGQLHQIQAAQAAGVNHVVLVGSMGGSNPNHMLNKIGNGNILIWKRKAEQILMDSGLDFTIIRAAGLLDQPGGERELLVGQDDQLLNNPPNGIPTSIPRADVAEVVVQALMEPNARNKVFDLMSKPPEQSIGKITEDFASLFAQAAIA
jgi:uncharacterized protein YbjT (DUF2867 family)